MILAMIERKGVQLNEIAFKLNDNVLSSSKKRCLQNFFKRCCFTRRVGYFSLFLFCEFGSTDLCMDRTDRDFGGKQINMLVISGA